MYVPAGEGIAAVLAVHTAVAAVGAVHIHTASELAAAAVVAAVWR